MGSHMIAKPRAARRLEIDELFAIIHLLYHLRKDIGKLRLRFSDAYAERLGAAVKTIDMLPQRKDLVISAIRGIVNAVTEIASAVKHGDLHLVKLTVAAVIISKCFQENTSRKK